MTIEEKAEEMIFNFFCGVRQEDYTHKETVRLMVKFATEATKELEAQNEELQQKYLSESYEKAKLVTQVEELKTEYNQTEKEYADLKIRHHDYCIKSTDHLARLNAEVSELREKLYSDNRNTFAELNQETALSNERLMNENLDLQDKINEAKEIIRELLGDLAWTPQGDNAIGKARDFLKE